MFTTDHMMLKFTTEHVKLKVTSDRGEFLVERKFEKTTVLFGENSPHRDFTRDKLFT